MTSELASLRQQRQQLSQQLANMEADFEISQERINAEIASARAAADGLAGAMRAAFGAASAAYAAKDGAMAAGLAAQGRALLAQCQAANAQASQVGDQLSAQRSALSQARVVLRQLDEQIRLAERRAKRTARPANAALKSVAIKGFHLAKGVNQAMVKQILGDLPPRLVAEIGSVSYVDRVSDDMQLGLTIPRPAGSDKPKVLLFKHPFYELDVGTQNVQYREALVHEAGHVLFERLTTAMRRFEWGDMFNRTLRDGGNYVTGYAGTSLREGFAECFMLYRLKPNVLYKKSQARYDFIDKICKEVTP